ncbi:MAG: 4-phosphoerythronate dehydrogenase [Rikenellaceae bacterium]
MKIIIDRAIPFIEGVLEPFAQVEYHDGMAINPDVVKDASALITRTRTLCNRELLSGSSIKAICSATIGFDHIDIPACEALGIEVRRAAGCNARAVLQWFAASIKYLCQERGWTPQGRTVGVVGVGNVGSLVAQYAQLWGFNVLCCDPPRAERESDFASMDLEQMLPLCDVVTFHTPLDSSTFHMLDNKRVALLPKGGVIFNSSRGGVLSTEALLASGRDYVLDVWEGEPDVSKELLDRALIATPHIAGYSIQGKARATAMVVNALSHIFELPLKEWRPDIEWGESCLISWKEMLSTIDNYFDIKALSDKLKSSPEEFESMRSCYHYRTDYF